MDVIGRVVDDRDPSIIYSAENWYNTDSSSYFLSTTTYTTTKGATAFIPFVGTQISVFGSIAPRSSGSSPVSSYSVDGSSETTYIAEQVRTFKFLQLFYRSPVLPLARHILSITCQADGPVFLLDYVVLFPLNVSDSNMPPYVSSVSSSSMGTSSSTSVQSFISTSSAISANPSSTTVTTTESGASSIASDSPNSSSTLHKSNQAAKIAGGIFAGLLFLALISIVGLYFLKRRRESRKAPSAMFIDHSMRQSETSWLKR